MLRVLKEKAESMSRSEEADKTDEKPTISDIESWRFVAVPESISIGKPTTTPLSSNSSLSSEGYHVMGSLTRISDDETQSMGLRAPPVHAPASESAHRISSESDKKNKKKRKEASNDNDKSDEDVSKKLRLSSPTISSVRLLALPEDATVLKPLHAFVRTQIEVFTATPDDIAQPAPGRKNPIRLHQVGLRCIHCRHLPSRDRVKRAVCYPSKVARVYHSVSDMKFDHFSACQALPKDVKEKFDELKAQSKTDKKERGTSTALYYREAAVRMGMTDANDGIFMAGQVLPQQPDSQMPALPSAAAKEKDQLDSPSSSKAEKVGSPSAAAAAPVVEAADLTVQLARPFTMQPFPPLTFFGGHLTTLPASLAMVPAGAEVLASSVMQQLPGPAVVSRASSTTSGSSTASVRSPALAPATPPVDGDAESRILAIELDENYLNPLHCFVRRNVELFVASEDDVAAPAPGRKTRISLGQVGIRCIHCARLSYKDRVKRSVCYPPSVSGVYHAVSNIKFDHFPLCKGLPEKTRVEFETLRSANNRRNFPSSGGGQANSTARYYHDSAAKLGLVDTPTGIRFSHQVTLEDDCPKTTEPRPPVAAAAPSPGTQAEADAGVEALMSLATTPREELERHQHASHYEQPTVRAAV